MNIKTTVILFGALVGALFIFGITQYLGVKKAGALDEFVFPEFHDKKKGSTSKDIDTVEIVRTKPKSETLVFVKRDDGWQMEKPYRGLRVDRFLVDRLVHQVTDAKKEKTDLAPNLGEYGLDEPGLVVTLKKGVEREWKLNVGKETGGTATQVVYVTSSARTGPMVVKRNDLDAVFKNLNDFRSKDLLGSNTQNTEAITVKVGDGEPLSLVRKDGKWQFEKPAYGEAEFDGEPSPPTADERKITGVRDLLDVVGQIRVESDADFVDANASDEDLKKYGLTKDKPERMRVEVKYAPSGLLGKEEAKKAVTETLLIGKKVEEKDAKVDRYYARLAGETSVVRITAKSFTPLVTVAGSPDLLRNRDLVQIDQNRADSIDITGGGGPLKLRKTDMFGEWKVFAGGAGRKADRMAVQTLLGDLTRTRIVKSFPSEKREAELGFDKPTAEVAIWVDGLKSDDKKDAKKDDKKEDKKEEKKEDKKEEKKDSGEPALKSDKPTVRLTFGKKEDNLLYVKRQVGDEKPTLVAIEAAPLLDKLSDGPLAYLDRMLPQLPPEETVTKLVLQRPGETFELEKPEKQDEKAGPPVWNLQQPATLKGRTVDPFSMMKLLRSLSFLIADKYVAEKPSDAELESKYGLKSPAYRVAVTTKQGDKVEEHVFLFGKEIDDKSGRRYAKLGNSDLIFQVQSNAIEPLKGQLLDTTVFRFDPAKVRILKLTGWHSIDPSIAPLEMERKDGQWKARLEVEGSKVDSFLVGLANLRAQNFIAGAAKPEYKLSLKEGGMEIAVTFEGDKEPSYIMTVGPHNATDKGNYATTNKLPNTVLLLPEELFKAPMSGPSHFVKK